MEMLGALCFSLILASLAQIPPTQAQVCTIRSIMSPSASSLLVRWSEYIRATNYFLDIRVKNRTDIAPVVVTRRAPNTEKVVNGLRPATTYRVTLKVFEFYYVRCMDTQEGTTVPGTSRITEWESISSTAIRLAWSQVKGAASYFLVIESKATGERRNMSLSTLGAEIHNLRPSTLYDCTVYSSNVAGLGGRGKVITVRTLVQAPEGITVTQTGKNTARVNWAPVNKVILYQVTVSLISKPASETFITNSTTNSLNIFNIQPCSTYNITVASLNSFLQPGDANYVTYTTNTLSPVTSLSVDYSCSSSSVTVMWGAVFGADLYRATAVDSNGTVLFCSSESTDCQITGVRCGETYRVHVISISDSCESSSNATTDFETVPCAPNGLALYRECSSNLIIFSWEPKNHTNYYVATAVDSTGERMDCLTTDKACFFDQTSCGREYTFTVHAVSEACRSDTSAPAITRTAPCAAKNLKTTAECYSDVLISTWDMAPGALQYMVEALGNAGQRHYRCNSFTNSCAMPGVQCGESLSVRIISADDECSSEAVLGEVAATVPCVPQNVSAVPDCSPDSFTVNWAHGNGAFFYQASAVHPDSSVRTCAARAPQCRIEGLRCGQTYTVFVISTNLKCNSSESERISVETGPCPPDRIEASLDCTANRALVTWRSNRNGASYTAIMEDQEGGLLSCMTIASSCTIPGLKCGQQYAVSVTQHNSTCPSMPTDTILMDSVPCGPVNMRTAVHCGTGVLNVTWDPSDQAEGYSAAVTSESGHIRALCNSTAPHCSFRSLECGRSYTVMVKSVYATCLSMPSTKFIREAPCVPTNVMVEHSCNDSSVGVMWEGSRGARYYNAVAVAGDSGHTAHCSSNGTACSLADLRCGQVYTVGVRAMDDDCASLQSQTVTLRTVPCPPNNLSAVIECADNSASLSWQTCPNAVSYLGRTVGTDGHTVFCDSRSPFCQMNGLRCGQEYAFTVSAADGRCRSPESTKFSRVTAPCALQGVGTQQHCNSDVLTVSWNASASALNYSATVRTINGTARSCRSAASSCDISSLGCSQQYSVTVTASNENCSGPASAAQTIQTVPCVPQGLMGRVECSNNSLTTSWHPSPGASSYTATLIGPGGHHESCSTPDLTCTFGSLLCARQYAVSVVAHGPRCSSAASSAISMATAACDPENVVTALHCQSGMLTVSWDASAGAAVYTVLAQREDQQPTSCRTASTSCQLELLDCGGEYNVTVLAGDRTCNSSSEPQAVIETAPCPPEINPYTGDCATNTAFFSWENDKDVVGFVINGTSTRGLKTSCSTTDSSCVLRNLQCGQTYMLHGTAYGMVCDSGPGPGTNIVTAPCAPASVNSQYDCGTNAALVSWNDSLGRETFRASVEGDGHADSCSTAETMCRFTGLRCGKRYNVTVSALAGNCGSSQAVGDSIQTAPCTPQYVNASLMCADNTAVVTWAPAAGAVSYNVTALGRDGDFKSCRATDTSCKLPTMHCGQEYAITVTPYSETCSGFRSGPVIYAAGPCPPNNVDVALQCKGNVGTVSWEAVIDAELYVATARDDDGNEHTCNSSSTSCSFTDLRCGETYSIVVVTLRRSCYSDPSPRKILKTAICPPINLEGTMFCGTNILIVMWDPSHVAGVTYFVVSEKDGEARPTLATADTSQSIMGMQCGEHYSFRVITQDSTCNSSLSLPFEQNTAPCSASHLATVVDCGTSSGTFSWVPGLGGVRHVVEVVGAHGHKASCSTNSTSCSVKLDCGRHYTATVNSTNGNCNSSSDTTIDFESAPCLPGDVVAQLNCQRNEFVVHWQGNPGTGTYTALAIGSDGLRASCNTTDAACTIKDLRCGQSYGITVVSSSIQCNQISGSDYVVESAPCIAMNPTVNMDCGTNSATVSWDSLATQQRNDVTAADQLGRVASCVTTNSSCTLDRLSCGEAYSFSIVGMTDQCRTPITTTTSLSAPCVPSHMVTTLDCDTEIVMVMWDSAQGATSYLVEAIGSLGHNDSCETVDTLCSMDQLSCGQSYDITVTAVHDGCRGLASETIVVTMGPCPHSNLVASRDCASNNLVISWNPGQGTLLYNASVESSAIDHHLSCSTNGTTCSVSSLQCGQRYVVSVKGHGLTCNIRPGYWVPVFTAPCPPTQVSLRSSCDSNVASVSWTDPSPKTAVRYVAAAMDDAGNVVMCNTSNTVCSITGLSCGRTYNVSVTALDEECIGGRSETHAMKTAPCVPTAVETNLVCQTGLLSVTWQRSNGALLYNVAVVQSRSGQIMAQVTVNSTDISTSLPCGHTYDVTVYASDEVCNSSHSSAETINAAPCPPVHVVTHMDCSTSITGVFWDSSGPGFIYTAEAIEAGGSVSSCSTTDSNCTLTGLHCGTVYNVTVSGSQGGCVGAQTSENTFRTAPCVPILTEVELDCLSDSAWVVWEESAGAELYTASAEDGEGRVFQCNTSERTCAVPDLQCGQHYTFTVAASDLQCTGTPSNAITSESAPCPPQIVVASMGCENRTASIAWAQSSLALTYTATLEPTDGETSCCTTAGTSCSIADLPCGVMYVLTVSAEGRACNSSPSDGSIIRTVPCTPQNLSASLSCSSNVAKVTWNSSVGGQLYIVQANGSEGHSAACSSFDDSCDLSALRCGQSYTITAMAEDSTCTSAKSQSAQLKTVPCVPGNVSADVDCASNTMTVSWTESVGADLYTATLEDSGGRSTNCQALGATSCNMSGLHCGETYRVTVAASDGYCTSLESPATITPSMPCPVSRVHASMDCMSRMAFVSWYFSAGTLFYTASMETESGDTVTCSTNFTNCAMIGLACGERYAVSVLALGESCSRKAQMTGILQTEPCVPLNLDVQYSMSIGQLTWDMSKGAEYYSAEAVTQWGQRASCNTTDTNCALYNMACSQSYYITVTAHNHACRDIATSDPVTLVTEPCAPRLVEADLSCETNAATISWETTVGALAYQAFLYGRDGHSTSCHTSNSSCSVDGLHCGTAYDVQVQALRDVSNSSDSSSFVFTTAPCATSAEVVVDFENGSALVTWGFSYGAVSYAVSVVGINGHMSFCSTEDNFCEVTELNCGETYNLTLTSINELCDFVSNSGLTFQTRPCAPLRVAVDLQCGNNTAMLSWAMGEGVELYVANATKSSGEHAGLCNSTGSTCLFSGLDCGETYSFTVTAYSSQFDSQHSDMVAISTGPCTPGPSRAAGSCGDDLVLLSWGESRGVSTYIVTAIGDLGYTVDFSTIDTSLEVQLPCGQNFEFSVVAQGEACDSPHNDWADFRTAPCIPEGLHTYVQCEGSMGSVSWMPSDGAESYTAVAVGEDSLTQMCTTNASTCTWTDLHCGGLYTVHVIANSNLCDSLPSNSTIIHMAPCVPQNLVSTLDCELRVGTLTWEASKGARLYIVAAEASNDHRVEVTTQTNSTAISELACGQVYYLTVKAVGSVCNSVPSVASSLRTEPCTPTNVSSQLDCLTNIVLVAWVEAAGAEYYTASVQAPDGQTSVCMSSNTQCGIPGLLCAQNYTVSVTASSTECSSAPSNSSSLRSAPCIPQDVAVDVDCTYNTALVSWSHSRGALSYRVVLGSGGGNAFCENSEPHCRLTNLTCGGNYTVWVVAMDSSCATMPSERMQFQSVPCTPEISFAYLDCFTDSILTGWHHAEGASFYTGVAETIGNTTVCNSSHTNCEITDLECGQVYSVMIAASNGRCNSSMSAAWEVESVPCVPQNVGYHLDCASGSALVTWEAAKGAESYKVHAIGWGGLAAECNTTELACVVPDLACGSDYHIRVVAIRQWCNVSESEVTEMQAVPCVPQQVEASVDCESGMVSVSWEQSVGATSYTVVAQGNGGYASTCNTSGTVCQFAKLLCGTPYSVTVNAVDDVCSSERSTAVHVDTVPCEPQDVSAAVDCSSNVGLVRWEHGEGAASYRVEAVGIDGHVTQCGSSSTSCRLPGLHCGQRYNLTVTAQDGQCDTSRAHLSLQSVPCVPHNVQAALQCQSNSISVAWERSSGALSYQAVGMATGERVATCNSSTPHCDLEALRCRQAYDISVLSLDTSCASAESGSVQIRTGPCPPSNLEASIPCASGIMLVMWDDDGDADSVRVEALTGTEMALSCHTEDTFCSITNMLCGHVYAVRAVSIRDGCESAPSRAVFVSSAPCDPLVVSGSLDCVTNSAWVTWEEVMGARTYNVSAEGVGGYSASCSTTDTTCSIPDLRCGVLYTFHLTASNDHCQSPPSPTFEIETAPCALTAIDAVTECHSGTIQVQWQLTDNSWLYTATAEDNNRSILSCSSTVGSCDLIGAQCGMQYTIIVATSSNKCSSLRSPPYKISTAPCVPQNVSFQSDCESSGVVVSWAPSFVAESYLLTARGRDGFLHTCKTAVSNCTLLGLQCGQPYSFNVTASSKNCSSLSHAALTYRTGPCDPDNLAVEFHCASRSAVLSWSAGHGSLEYFAYAEGSSGDILFCGSSDSSCVMDGLDCGAVYNFSVLASDGICNSSLSVPLHRGAVPCPPEHVKTTMLPVRDEDKVLRVSWSRVSCPVVEYLVEVTGRILGDDQALMEVASGWTERNFSEFPLPCSSTYNVTVKSGNSAGTSKPSLAISGYTVPCPPQNVTYVGNSTLAILAWRASIFATMYTVYKPSGTGRTLVCNTTQLFCKLNNIQCVGFEITAGNAAGESSPATFRLGPISTRRKRNLLEIEMLARLRENEDLVTPRVLVYEVKRESLQVQWRAVSDASYYTLLISDPAGELMYHTHSPMVKSALQEAYTVTGLKPNTTYCVSVSARSSLSSSAYSQPICVDTVA